MNLNRHVALLRGINVGGSNLIRMTDLKACFELQGFDGVCTYIQSGNVLFDSVEADRSRLADKIEAVLSKTFNYQSRVVICSWKQMKAIVDQAPEGFGVESAAYHYDVIFLKDPLTAAQAIKNVSTKPGVDKACAGNGVLYFSRLIAGAAQSHLSRIVNLPMYHSMTIRNWNTTTKLCKLMEAPGEASFAK